MLLRRCAVVAAAPGLRGAPPCWQWSRNALLGSSKEARAERRKELWEEVNKGYFSDLHEFRHTRGKRFEAASQLTSRGESVCFPALSGPSLERSSVLELPADLMGSVSLVLVSQRGLGMRQCLEYCSAFENRFKAEEDTQVVELSLVDRWVFRVLKRWMERNLRKTVPQHRQRLFMCYAGAAVAAVRRTMDVSNTIVGHAYLVDKEGRVRWRAVATPTQAEVASMLKCTKELLEEKDSQKKKKAKKQTIVQ